MAVLLAIVSQQVYSIRLGYRVEAARAALQKQENLDAYLRVELQRMRAPASLLEQARRRLKMEAPSPSSIIELEEPPVPRSRGLIARLLGRSPWTPRVERQASGVRRRASGVHGVR